jgi:hypothetical protein
MKKVLAMTSLAALAACGGGGEEKAKAPAAAREFSAGQWQSNLEVANFRQTDQAPVPKLNMPVGTKAQGAACIAGDTRRPPPQLFVGPDFTDCAWGDNFYMGNGRLQAPMTCRRAGVGEIEVSVNVNFTAESYEGTVDMNTRLPEDGDVLLSARAEGRRTGAQCAPEADPAGNNQSATK